MKTGKIAIAVLVLIIISVFIGLTWYKNKYSMSIVTDYEINSTILPKKILIATQGSTFKNKLTEELIKRLSNDSNYLKIIDVTDLGLIIIDDWDAIVIMHTWENWEAQFDAYQFAKTAKFDRKLIIVTTSGSGNEKMLGIDAISSASVIQDIPEISNEIVIQINKLTEN